MESLALFKLSNGRIIGFWTDTWIGVSTLNVQFPNLFRIALLPRGSDAAHWIILLYHGRLCSEDC